MRSAAISTNTVTVVTNSGASAHRTTASARNAVQRLEGAALRELSVISRQPTLSKPGPGRGTVIVAIVLLHVLFIWMLQSISFKAFAVKRPTELFVTMMAVDHPASPPQRVPLQRLPKKALPMTLDPVLPATDAPASVIVPADVPPAPVVVAKPAQAPPQAPAIALQPKTISSGVEYSRAPVPVYPAVSRRLREQGRALIRVLVDKNGLPESAAIEQSSGSPRLDEAARQAVLNALFKPLLENGSPVAVYALVPIRFQLDS